MRIAILTLVIFLLTFNVASASYSDDITIRSHMLTFTTGQYVSKMRGSDTVLVDNPMIVQNALYSFNNDLSLEFWNDPRFHPAVLGDTTKYHACGRYPTQLCIAMNEYGGFVVANRDLPDEFIGYGAYDRMRISRGRLFPTGQSRYNLMYKNMELLTMNPSLPVQLTKSITTAPTWFKRGETPIVIPNQNVPYQYTW